MLADNQEPVLGNHSQEVGREAQREYSHIQQTDSSPMEVLLAETFSFHSLSLFSGANVPPHEHILDNTAV